MTDYPKADLLPEVTDLNRPYWEGLNEGVLRLQHCGDCESNQYPPETFCYACGSMNVAWQDSSGEGAVHTFITVHQKYHPAFYEEVPYNVSVIELDDGVRLVSNLVGVGPDQVRIGQRVRAAPRLVSADQHALYFEPA